MSDGGGSGRSYAIVPAAGISRRMGQPKLLLPWKGRAVIEWVLAAWRASCVDAAVVVARADDEALLDICRRMGVDVVAADPAPKEMKDSVAVGLEFVRRTYAPGDHDAWVLAPADMPRLSAERIDRVLGAHRWGAEAVTVAWSGGRRGHPVVFPWVLAAEVAELGPDDGVRALMEGRELTECEVPSVEDEDLDTPEDYERLTGGER